MEEILHQTERLEKEYDWLKATELYEKALNLLSEDDFSRKGDVTERLGYAFYRAAFQAESSNDFRDKMRQAVEYYEQAREFYGKIGEPEKPARELCCDAMIAQVSYWLASSQQEKKKLASECWTCAKACLDVFEKASEANEYGRTYNQLSTCIDLGFFFDWDFKAREKMIREALECGEKAVKFLFTAGDLAELARAYVKTANFLETFSYYFVEFDERDRHHQKAKDYVDKAIEVSEEAAMIEVPTVLFGEGPGGYWGDGTETAVRNFEKGLEHGRKTRDKFIIGRAFDLLTYHTMWESMTPEDPDELAKLRKRVLKYTEDARRQYSIISFISPRGGGFWVEGPFCHYYNSLWLVETDLGKRRGFLEKALEAAPEELKRAESSGYPAMIYWGHEVYGWTLLRLSRTTTDRKEKQRLLEEGLLHLTEANRIIRQADPLACWNLGLLIFEQAAAKSDLADMVKEDVTKKSMLQEAILDMRASLNLCVKDMPRYDKEGSAGAHNIIGFEQYEIGSSLNRLHLLSHDNKHLIEATEAFDQAAESFQKLNLTSRIAECLWKSAQIYGTLGEHLKAAERFDLASNNYKSAGEKIPQLKGFYQDYAAYMQAWCEIEKARHHHLEKQYGPAKEHYEKAASLHKSTKQWRYLNPNYLAWAKLEEAEDLSRREQTEQAKDLFRQAAEFFAEAKKSIQTELEKIESKDEKEMSISLVESSDARHEYCLGRIALEEAKILDRQGDHATSSRKYEFAAVSFQKAMGAMEHEPDRQELKPIVLLCQAWHMMTRAESEASPDMYKKASQLFEDAKDHTLDEKAKMLALGHSRFCNALEAGTRFADTRDIRLHGEAERYLESAANYYVKAGFPKVSEYAEATGLLFDAYVHMDEAKREKDPERKTKLYAMAERVLQTSAGSFMKAEHPEKREQVLGLLEKVKKEQELALSLTELLHAPSIVSTTTTFTTPTPSGEEAVGSERFEHADVQANLIIRQKELKIGENLSMELELVNAGKGSALLTKVTEIIPKGFEVAEKPETFRVEDSYINLKGKRLDPLKTEEVKLVLKPTLQGTFSLKPTVLYLDENGKYKSHEPEPVTIIVKELGIKSWLKGER